MTDQPDSDEGEPDLLEEARGCKLGAYLKKAKSEMTEEEWAALVDEVAAHYLTGRLDLATAFAGEAGARLNYASQTLVGELLPRLSDQFADLVRLIDSISALSGGGLPYYLVDPVGRWCEGGASRPMEALTAIRTGSAPNGLLRIVLFAGFKVDRVRFLSAAINLATASNAAEKEAACDVLGRFAAFDEGEEGDVVTALEATLSSSTGGGVVAPLRALLLLSLRSTDRSLIGLRALRQIAPRSDAHVRQAVAAEFMFKTAHASTELASAAFDLLLQTEKAEKTTLDFIDQIVSGNLTGQLFVHAQRLLDGLLGTGAADMRSFSSTKHFLLGTHRAQLRAIVTRWLTSENLAHFVAVRELCIGGVGNPLTFELDFGGSALTADRAARIGRWTCVVLMIFPETAASVLVSLMRTGPSGALAALGMLLFDPILISYWTGPRAYLDETLPTLLPAVACTVRDAISRLDRYKVGVDAAQDIPELRPSQHRRFLVQLKRRDEQLAIDKNAREGAVLASLFPMSVMLFGDSAIYEMEVEPGNTVRQETQLATIEYSHELPRLEVIDPFGTWYQREQLLHEGDDT